MKLDMPTLFTRIVTLCKFFEQFGKLTTCKRKPVGCGVFTLDCNNIPAIAHNGPPDGLKKNRCKNDDPCGCGHSEPVAMGRLNLRDWEPGELFIFTGAAPCLKCALAVISTRSIGFWIYRKTAYPIDVLETVVKESGIVSIPIDVFEYFLKKCTDGDYMDPLEKSMDYSLIKLEGLFMDHANKFHPNSTFPYISLFHA